jgi:hypothetical protein
LGFEGKSKPNEYVVFSGHYDHLGVGSPRRKQHDTKILFIMEPMMMLLGQLP